MQKRVIWLVEDEASIADTLIYALQTDGFEVEWFMPGPTVADTTGTDATRLLDPRCGAARHQRLRTLQAGEGADRYPPDVPHRPQRGDRPTDRAGDRC